MRRNEDGTGDFIGTVFVFNGPVRILRVRSYGFFNSHSLPRGKSLDGRKNLLRHSSHMFNYLFASWPALSLHPLN